MRILFELCHPKHYYQFKYTIKLLQEAHEIKIIARRKDIVCSLLDAEGVEYEVYGSHGKGMLAKLLVFPIIMQSYRRIVKTFSPDLIVSKSSPYAVITGKIHGIKTCIMPDSEVVTFTNKFVVPLSNMVITPKSYSIDYGDKHRRVSGFFENGYLHPEFFDTETHQLTLESLPRNGEQFAILRFVGWYANHDVRKFGFSDAEKIKLVNLLKDHCQILISSEAPLPFQIEKFRFQAPVNRMHHALRKAALYIGDSQTMATEAALCGTPAIRYNSFVGKEDMSNFKILAEYGMLWNVSTFEEVCTKAQDVLMDSSSKERAEELRKRYFENVGNINEELRCYIEGMV